MITIYTDGSSRGNPGKGGYGAILIYNEHVKEISQGFRYTTNNRMELLSVIVALESLKKDGMEVTLYSDSKYVVDAVEKNWIWGWRNKNFAKVKNPDLWKRFLIVFQKHKVNFVWVKGHADNPLNNRCDQLATSAADGNHLIVDVWYEKNKDNNGLF